MKDILNVCYVSLDVFSWRQECSAVTICNSQLSAINIISLISLFFKMNEITVKIKINLYAQSLNILVL